MKVQGWLACISLVLAVAAACSGDDGKKVSRGDAGAGGEGAAPASGGSLSPAAGESSGGSAPGGSGPSGGQGGAEVEPSEAGAAGEGQAGSGGQPAAALTLADLEGSWSGHILSTYVCESAVRDIELTIEGDSVVSTWPSSEDLGSGTVVQQDGQSFTLGLFIDNPNFNQNYLAQLYVDPTGQYAIFVALAQLSDGPSGAADIAILQKSAAVPLDAQPSDFYGDWAGVGFRLDDDLAVATEFPSSATFSGDEDLIVTGEDADGAFTDTLYETQFAASAFVVERLPQGDETLGAMFLMSNDKRMLAVALLRELDANDGALCDLTDPFADMSIHKFALWTKAE